MRVHKRTLTLISILIIALSSGCRYQVPVYYSEPRFLLYQKRSIRKKHVFHMPYKGVLFYKRKGTYGSCQFIEVDSNGVTRMTGNYIGEKEVHDRPTTSYCVNFDDVAECTLVRMPKKNGNWKIFDGSGHLVSIEIWNHDSLVSRSTNK